jgi:hypothetical protein
MKTEEYDESKVLNDYLTRHFWWLMTDLERRSYRLAIQREKAKASRSCAARLPQWMAGAGADAVEMSNAGPQELGNRFRRRLQRDIWSGRVVVNRCPQCSRIVRTPLARQCPWCGFDWHGT